MSAPAPLAAALVEAADDESEPEEPGGVAVPVGGVEETNCVRGRPDTVVGSETAGAGELDASPDEAPDEAGVDAEEADAEAEADDEVEAPLALSPYAGAVAGV